MIAVLVVFAFIIFICLPAYDARKNPIEGWFYHRGNHSKDQSVCENTREAFTLAAADSIGIELDVRLSKDEVVYVFHDATCERLCGTKRSIESMFGYEIDALRLPDGASIPTFESVLEHLKGRVPIMIEIKPTSNVSILCQKVAKIMNDYPGDYSIESFDPRIVLWFRKNHPRIRRGQLVMRPQDYDHPFVGLWIWLMLPNIITRPHYMATEVKIAPWNPFFKLFQALGGSRVGWTVHRADHLKTKAYDASIVEFYNPNELDV